MKKVLNKCPICNSKIQYSRMMSFSMDSIIKRNGEPSVKEKKGEVGPLECGFISCTNEDCNFATDCDLHSINHNNIRIGQEYGKFYYEVLDESE